MEHGALQSIPPGQWDYLEHDPATPVNPGTEELAYDLSPDVHYLEKICELFGSAEKAKSILSPST